MVVDRLQQAADKGLLARGHNTLRDVVLFNHSTDKGKIINKLSRSDQGEELKGQVVRLYEYRYGADSASIVPAVRRKKIAIR